MKFPGVSVITIGPALGHDTEIDAVTLDQVAKLGNAAAPVKVFPDHDESVTDLIGAMSNFRVEGEQVRADMELIAEHPLASYYSKILGVFPESLGFSISWMGSCIEAAGAKFARVSELLSVDLVSRAAANPSGVYSSRSAGKKLSAFAVEPPDAESDDTLPVDTNEKDNMTEPTSAPAAQAATAGLAADPISAALAPITDALAAISAKLDAFIAADAVEDAQPMEEDSEDSMSAKLDAVITKLSVLEEAGRGTDPVEGDTTGDNLVTRFESLSSDSEKVAFARRHPELRKLLSK
jgi:hypothetical protein